MKKSVKLLVGFGVAAAGAVGAATWYSVMYNDSRLVEPMDFSTYTFQAKDLPMILSGIFLFLYVIALVVTLFRTVNRRNHMMKETNTTRRLNPKLGFLGFLGLLGLGGFWTYTVNGMVFPFAFFLFFGFFGFFYEGKMSGTFMDERFRENAARAQLNAFKFTNKILIIALIVFCQGTFMKNLEYTLIAVIIVLALTLGLGMFLSEYLLYRYDQGDQLDEDEE